MLNFQRFRKLKYDVEKFKFLYQYRPDTKTILLKDTKILCDFNLWKPNAEVITYMVNTENDDDWSLMPYEHKIPRSTIACCGFFQRPEVVLGKDMFTDHSDIPYAWEYALLHECGHYLLQSALFMYTGDIFIKWADPGVMHQVINEYGWHKKIQFHREHFNSDEQFNHATRLLHHLETIHHQAIHRNVCDVYNQHSINLSVKTKRGVVWDAIRSVIDSWTELYDHWESAEYYMTHAKEPIKIKNELEADLFTIANFPIEHGSGFHVQMCALSDTQGDIIDKREKLLRRGFSEEYLDGCVHFFEVYATILECVFKRLGFDTISEVYRL